MNKNRNSKLTRNLLILIGVIILVNLISQKIFFRWDLTSEKRYSITDFSESSLKNLKGNVNITVYLSGKKLPLNFKKFQKSIEQILSEFKIYGGKKINFKFVDIYDNKYKTEDRRKIFKELNELGVYFVQNTEFDKSQATQSIIVPGCVLEYTFYDFNQNKNVSKKVGINLLDFDSNYEQTSPQNINNSTQTLEYKFINEINKLSKPQKPLVVFLEGHGELPEANVIDFERSLAEYYEILRGEIKGRFGILDSIALLIIAKPTQEFSDADKYIIDQYIMRGGKVLWLIDGVNVSMDSIYFYEKAYAFPANTQVLKIDDILFTYGIRLNSNIIQDYICSTILLKAQSPTGQAVDYQYKWHYFPLIITNNNHPINKYIDAIRTEFVSSIDTVGNNTKIKKTILLSSSNTSKIIPVNFPVEINFKEIMKQANSNEFTKNSTPIAYLLEGEFYSHWKGRISKYNHIYKTIEISKPTKMIIIADGDIAKNIVKSNGETMPMDFDKFSLSSFKGSKQFLINSVNYLLDESNIMQLRMRQIKLRLLKENLTYSQIANSKLINVALPVIVIVLLGFFFNFIRKRKYTK